ncbi:hypothetical protein PU560_05850, partial [Georgenia sp. 10Sc9-8]|nr:hypothetical protein [Georgenia halotolerans]
DRVHRLIVNLRRHDADPADVDCLALCDADLATLAVEPQRYEDYRRAVREEYAHIPLRDYLSARIAILSRLLDRRNLFLSPMGARWEDAARENLAAELGRLRSKLATLGDADGHEVGTPSATSPAEAPTDGAATADPGAVPVPAGTDGPAPEPQAPVGGMEARVLRSPEPRPSSLETDPEELGLRRTARAPSTTDPERARRAERAKIAERGRARVEQAMRDRARAPGAAREPGHRTAAAATPRTAPSPTTATPPTAPTPPDVEHPVRETGPEPAPPPEHRSEARDTEPVTTAPDGARHAADATEPSRQDGRTHGMERDPELLEPAHRRRQRERRAPQRPTRDWDGPESTARPPRRRGPG